MEPLRVRTPRHYWAHCPKLLARCGGGLDADRGCRLTTGFNHCVCWNASALMMEEVDCLDVVGGGLDVEGTAAGME